MKANELRVHNILLFDGKQMFIEEIASDKVVLSFNGVDGVYMVDLNDDDLQSISLTGEWPAKFGFEHTSPNEYTKGRFTYRKQQRDIIINGSEYDYNGILISAEGMQVHEFQNLFYTIEREELEIKETVTP